MEGVLYDAAIGCYAKKNYQDLGPGSLWTKRRLLVFFFCTPWGVGGDEALYTAWSPVTLKHSIIPISGVP